MLAFPVSIVRFYTNDAAVLPIAVEAYRHGRRLPGLRRCRSPPSARCAAYETPRADAHHAAAYWGIGFPCTWIFGIALRHGPRVVWAGLVLGLTLAAVLLLRRFYRLTQTR